jgi:hypothetical protein
LIGQFEIRPALAEQCSALQTHAALRLPDRIILPRFIHRWATANKMFETTSKPFCYECARLTPFEM